MEVYCSVSCVPIQLIISLILCPYVCGNLFKEVSSCPSDENEWRDRAQKKDCKEPIPDFMCAVIENQPGRFGEICTFVGLTGKDKCVVLDADTYNLNFVKCYATFGCPSNAYISSNLYKYPVCYNYSRETTTSISTTGTEQHEQIASTKPENTEQDGSVHSIVISTFTVFLCVLFVFLLFWMKRRISKRKKDLESNEAEEPSLLLNTDRKLEALCTQTISMLGIYMKFQLVNLSKHKNLQFYMVMYSESLKLHFKENFDKMMNLSSVDLTKFDLDIVYTLLTNFCGITCPDRNWGYKPTDEDISVGADIERIRILVNEYLDNKTFKLGEADQILERWIWIKKEIDPRDIIDFHYETKINYKKLKPNTAVQDGIVFTRGISNIMENLKSQNMVTCRGAIGCGKTTALKYVTKKYKDNGWTIKWIEEYMDEFCYNRLLKHDSEFIIICCDNLFGSFGCQVFSEDMFTNFQYYMRSLLTSGKHIKVLLAIHNHVIDEFPANHSPFPLEFNVIVKLDSLSRTEALLIYTMQQKIPDIEQEYIPFDNFMKLYENRSDVVGTPFQTLMISADLGVFGTEAFYNQPFQELMKHFTDLYYRNEEIFYTLLYIMCVMIFDTKEAELKRGIANAIYPRLDRNTVVKYLHVPDLAPYVKNDGDTVETKHDVISIALFHTYMMESKKPWSIFSACDIRGILELIRPDDQRNKLHQFAVPVSREALHEAKTILKTKIFHDKVDIKGHPLSKHFS